MVYPQAGGGSYWNRRSRLPSAFVAGALLGVGIAALAIPRANHDPSSAKTALGVPGASAAASGEGGPGAAGATASASGGSVAAGSAGAVATGASTGPASSGSGAGQSSAGGGSSAAVATASGKPASPAGVTSTNNGGATYRGVTADSVTIGVLDLDSNTFGAVCPRCGNGDGANGAATAALLAAWKGSGMDTVYGRHIQLTELAFNALNSEQLQSTCEQMVQRHPFLIVGDEFLGVSQSCLAQNKMIGIDGLSQGDAGLLSNGYPYLWQLQPDQNTVWYNFPHFLEQRGVLANQTLCMYSPDDSNTGAQGAQEDLNATLRAELKRLGHSLKVDITYGSAPNDGIAVEEFKTNNCTVAFVLGQETEPSGFQNSAEAQSYRPKYPIAEADLEMSDSLGSVQYNANAEDGNIGMHTNFFNWLQRKPPEVDRNQTAQFCVDAYQKYEHTTYDVYTNDSNIRYALNMCSTLEVVRQALINAGPDLTYSSFVGGLQQIRNMQTSDEISVTFSRTQQAGGNMWSAATFSKNTWPQSGDFWGSYGPWTAWYYPVQQ